MSRWLALLLALLPCVADAQPGRGSNPRVDLVEDPAYDAPTLLVERRSDAGLVPSPGTVNGLLVSAVRLALAHPDAVGWRGLETAKGTWLVESVRAVCHLVDGQASGTAEVRLAKWGDPLKATTVDPANLQRSSSEIWDTWLTVFVDAPEACAEGFGRVTARLADGGTFGNWARMEIEIETVPSPPRASDGRVGLVALPLTDGVVDFGGELHYVGRPREVSRATVDVWRVP
jgi:hypothetical protein